MALQYIDENLLRIDEVVEDILDYPEQMDAYYADIDSKVVAMCREEGVLQADIPVNATTGFVESAILTRVAKFYGLWIINLGYNGIGNGELDDVYQKWKKWVMLFAEERKGLTKETILGGGNTDPVPNPVYTVRQAFVSI